MKPKLPLLLLAAVLCAPVAPAQTEDPHTRLVQAYMARRAEWVALRAREQKRAKEAKDDQERKSILQKLAADERPLRAAAAELARQVRDSEKARQPEAPPRG